MKPSPALRSVWHSPKHYLSAHDSEVAKRTWQDVIDRLCAQGKPQTQEHRRRVSNRQPQSFLKNMKVIETTADDLMKILKAGGVMTNAFVRGLHNLAVGVGWLPMPILPPKLIFNRKPGVIACEDYQIC